MAEQRPVFQVAVGGFSLGALIAILVLVICVVLWIVGGVAHEVLGLIAALALARLT